MTHYDNLYCKLFIDTDIDINSLFDLVCQIVSGFRKVMRTVVTDLSEIDIMKNDDFDALKKDYGSDGFLFFKYYCDIQPTDYIGLDEGKYISSVSLLLESLWDIKINAVCACDFEGELPRMGGYNPNR
ncbi:1,4-dihydroxy-6-naphthoate synthase [Paenibacillus sp. HWE-109]|uniref:1,4-dihydroxy-6-naphthoate synthase n=1 Tax=Paenibacillus sp. HWE-109 TaxID=1306526 RepID=UPI001EDDBC09|nr:1,4-dihydroxy-6-naphthoate synthase [Paenibacillus sp. HWE-109]UKS27362.1 1,4-dihydroxy-6-naphthoate synthase [Paenibacillus sp. HWE-109]